MTNDSKTDAGDGAGRAAIPKADYKCENCIGMIEHGCYCQAVGAVAPGGPLPSAEGKSP